MSSTSHAPDTPPVGLHGRHRPPPKEQTLDLRNATYEIGRAPGDVEKLLGEPTAPQKYHLSPFWHTEIGPPNEIIHVWGYKDLAERARIRGEAAKDANWPPKISEFIKAMRVEVVNAFDFVPTPTPGKMGPVFEIRYYTLKGGSLPDTAKRWEGALPERISYAVVSRRRESRRHGFGTLGYND